MSTQRTTSESGLAREGARDALSRVGEFDPLERLGRLSWRRPARGAKNVAWVFGAFAGILVGLGVTVAIVAGIAAGVVALTRSIAPLDVAPHGHVTEVMKIVSGTLAGVENQPRYTNPNWTVHVGERVTVKIVSFDDGTAPLMGSQMMYDKVSGSTDEKEQAGGTTISRVPDADVAHTFTVVGLGFNMPIPAAPTGKSVVVEATFVPTKAGTFTWQCYAPCGGGTNGMGGAMSAKKWMEGTIKVTA